MRVAADTNVLVRYLTWDDEDQARLAAEVLEAASTVVIPAVVLCEVVWVLRGAYRYGSAEIAAVIRGLVDTRGVEVDRPAVETGLRFLEAGGDFADGVIVGEAATARCDRLVTFDQTLARIAGTDAVMLLK